MDENATGKAPHKISNVAAAFMIGVAILLDLTQFLLTLTVFLSPVSILITFLALCIFGVWFALFGINYFSGKKGVLKVVSVFGSAIIELVPLLDALPTITVGVIGIIVSSRLEERSQPAQKEPSAVSKVRFMPQTLPPAANNNEGVEEQREAA